MNKIPNALIFVLLVVSLTIAEGISIRYIEANFSDNNDFKLINKKIQLGAEPYARNWVHEWNYDVPKDSVFAILHEAEKFLKNASLKKPTERSLLLLGMVYHFLYQLDEKPAFEKADSVLTLFQKKFPERIEGPWFRAVHLVKGAHQTEGITLFDSLRIASDIKNAEFWEDFSRYSYIAFQPNRAIMGIKKYKELTGKRSEFDKDYGDTLRSKIKEMNVKTDLEPKAIWTARKDSSSFVTFVSHPLGISLRIPSEWKLNIPGYSAKNKRGIFDMIPNNVVHPKTGEPIETHILLMVDFSEPKNTLKDQVYSFSKEKPDKIEIRNDLTDLNAYSISFYSKSIYPQCGGSHMVLTSFDRLPPKYPGVLLEECQQLENQDLTFYRMNAGLVRPSKKIRYLFLLDACYDISKQAEKNLKIVYDGLKVE